MIRLEMQKLEYNISRESAKLPGLSTGKINKYEYLRSEEILPVNQREIIEQAKIQYSP